jgi:uncharacterized protein
MSPAEGNAGNGNLSIEVSRDHVTAYLHVRRGAVVSVEDVMKLLEEKKIVYGIKDRDKIKLFLDNLELYDHTLIIASGKPFTLGCDAVIKYHFETDARNEAGEDITGRQKIDFRKIGTIASVKKEDVIATKIPAKQGEMGVTIYGQKLPGEWGMDVTLKAGVNVALAPNGLDFIAEKAGAPIVSGGTIRVDPIFVVNGDVDYSSGNIDFEGTVAVRGSVLDGFEVNAGGDVIVENTIQSARVRAGGDIVVKRGIITRNKGVVSAEGNVYAKFIENSIVECEGNVIVETAILSSEVFCNGRIVAVNEDGAIIGGRVIAFDRVICRNLGSVSHTATYAQVGYRFEVQQKYLEGLAKIRAVQAQIKEIQKSYEYVSKTNAEDYDKLGELRGKMVKMIRVHDQMKDDLHELNATRIFNQFAMVEVESAVFPGAHVVIGEARYPIKKDAKYASFKWDGENKNIYLSSFDETGQGSRQTAVARAKSVLIIDDSKAVRKALRLIVERMGLRVADEAEDGEIGVQKFRQLRPTLVTCDIAMVNLDGIQTLKAIRKENPNARVIMISSIRDKNRILDCILGGSRDYILKPFVPSRVITVIKNVLEN